MTEQAVILPSFVRSTNKSKTEFSEFQQASSVPSSIRAMGGRFYADEFTVPLMDRCQSLAAQEQLHTRSFGSSPHLLSVRQP